MTRPSRHPARFDADGTCVADPKMFRFDASSFKNTPGVTVIDFPTATLNPSELDGILNGPGTTVGGFCNSGACLAPYK